MISRSEDELTVIQQLALTVYLNIYKDVIDVLKPNMGLINMDERTVLSVFDRMMSMDYVVDITEGLPPKLQRPSIRSYVSSASNSDRHVLLRNLVDIIRDPRTPPYFRGFRKTLMTYVVGVAGRKRWHMGNITANPTVHPDGLGNNIVRSNLTVTITLRNN